MKKIFVIAFLLLSVCMIGCYKGNAQQKESSAPETLEVIYQNDGEYSLHYILRDNETGHEYIVVVRHLGGKSVSTSITPRLGVPFAQSEFRQ